MRPALLLGGGAAVLAVLAAAAPFNLGTPSDDYARPGGPDWASRITMADNTVTYEAQYSAASAAPALIAWNTRVVVTASVTSYCCWSQDWRAALDSPFVLDDSVLNVDGGTAFGDGGPRDGSFVDGGFVDGGSNLLDGGLEFVDSGTTADGGIIYHDGGEEFVDGGVVDGGVIDGGWVDGGITMTDGGIADEVDGICAGWGMQPGQTVTVLPLYPLVMARAATRIGVCTRPTTNWTSANTLVYPPCRVNADCTSAGSAGTCDTTPTEARRRESGTYLVCRSDDTDVAAIDVRTER